MYDQSKLSELIRFARVDAGSTVIDVYPGDGDWTRLFSDIVGPEGRVYSFVPAEVAHFKNDPVGRMRTLAKEPGRENVEAVSADLVAMQEATQPADVLWLHLFYHDLHTALIQARGATAARFNRAVYERLKPGGSYVISRPRRRRRGGHARRPVAASDRACIRSRGGGGGRLRTGRGKHHAREQGRSALDQGVRSLDQGRDRSLRLSVREALTVSHPSLTRLGRELIHDRFRHGFRRRHQQCLTAAIRAQASVVQTDDPLETMSADQRHVGRDPGLELPAPTDVETNMTYAAIGAGLVGETLARFSPRTFPSSSPTRAAPKPSTNSRQGSGHASRLCRLSVLHRTFPG